MAKKKKSKQAESSSQAADTERRKSSKSKIKNAEKGVSNPRPSAATRQPIHGQEGSKMRKRRNTPNSQDSGRNIEESMLNGSLPNIGPQPHNNNAPEHQEHHRHHSHYRPHSRIMVGLMKVVAVVLVTMYFLVPLVVKLNPWIMREAIFLNRFRWPPFIDLANPEELGMTCTRNFYVRTQESPKVELGVWHVLPREFSNCHPVTEAYFTDSLNKGMPIILYLHGNAGTRAGKHRTMLYKKLASSGYHVVAFDYRGYADSSGSPTEEGVAHDALAIYRWIRKYSGNISVYLWGHSLGSGIATKVAKQLSDAGEPPTGLVLEAPFTNIIDIAYKHPFAKPFTYMPYFTWVFIEALKYENITFQSDLSIRSVTCPVLILHARDDGIVPFEQGYELYQAALRGRQEQQKQVKFVEFAAVHGYGHKHIHKAPELSHVLWKFTNDNFVEDVAPEKLQPPAGRDEE